MVPSSAGDGHQFEEEVRYYLKKIGLRDVNGGANFRVGGHQIDACGGWDDFLLVCECTQSQSPRSSIRNLILELRGKAAEVRRGFRGVPGYESYRRFEFAIVTRGIEYTQNDCELARQRPAVRLIPFQVLSYYRRLADILGHPVAIFNFLGELGVAPRDLDVPRVPAFRVQLSRRYSGYLFWCIPQELLKVAYVARRESGREKYYQRMLSAPRLKKIAEFVNKGGVFPNNIIIAFDRRPTFRPKQGYDSQSWPRWLQFGELIFPLSYRSCWVVDGQHRLYAFGKVGSVSGLQKVAVFAFDPIKEYEQAKFFIEINKEQKPVSQDLIWDLEGEMSPDTVRGQIANCVKKLNGMPPLEGLIYQPLSGERRRGQLKISGVCQDLDDIGFLRTRTRHMMQTQTNPLAHRVQQEDVPGRAARAIADFLQVVHECCQQRAPDLWSKVILRPGGITLALSVYEQILIRLGHVPTPGDLTLYAETFVQTLKEVVHEEGIGKFIKTRLTSYAQRREVSSDVVRQIRDRLGDENFGKSLVSVTRSLDERLQSFERRLAEFVCQLLSIENTDDLLRRSTPDIAGRVRERMRTKGIPSVHEALTLGEIKEIVQRPDNAGVIMPYFIGTADGFGDEPVVRMALDIVQRARDDRMHGRPVRVNRRFLLLSLETFEKVLGRA